jgi:hypothetical protein
MTINKERTMNWRRAIVLAKHPLRHIGSSHRPGIGTRTAHASDSKSVTESLLASCLAVNRIAGHTIALSLFPLACS